METTTEQAYLQSMLLEQESKTHPEKVWRVDTRAFGGNVNVDDEWEAHIWCRRLGCTMEQLREAVKLKGTSANALRRHFEMKEYGNL